MADADGEDLRGGSFHGGESGGDGGEGAATGIALYGVGENFAEGFDEVWGERETDGEVGGACDDGGAAVAEEGGQDFCECGVIASAL